MERRAPNFTKEEEKRLYKLVKQFPATENVKTDAVSSAAKNEAWLKVEELFNYGNEYSRNANGLREKYLNMRRQLRKRMAGFKKQDCGGAPVGGKKISYLKKNVVPSQNLPVGSHDKPLSSGKRKWIEDRALRAQRRDEQSVSENLDVNQSQELVDTSEARDAAASSIDCEVVPGREGFDEGSINTSIPTKQSRPSQTDNPSPILLLLTPNFSPLLV